MSLMVDCKTISVQEQSYNPGTQGLAGELNHWSPVKGRGAAEAHPM